MSSSDEIKEAIVRYCGGTGIKGTREKDWKRVSKKTLPGGDTLREFHNATLDRTFYTLGEDEDASILEKDQWIYGYVAEGNDTYDGDAYLAFEPLDRWNRERHQYDQHQGYILGALLGLPAGLDEASENIFIVPTSYNALTIHMALKRLGYQHNQEYSDFLSGSGSPPALAPTAPVNPPVPGLIAAASPPPPGVPVTGLPTAAILPVQYPELVDQRPEVKIALQTARVLRKLGLEQENATWMDAEELREEIEDEDNDRRTFQLERSHALWLLYEDADNGSGEVIPDFFSMPNSDLVEELLEERGILDFCFDGQDLEIIPDTSTYSTPYDLPVPPEPVVAPPTMPAMGGSIIDDLEDVLGLPSSSPSGPPVGPASVRAGSGSFAGLPTPQPAAAPVAPPAGNVKAEIVKNPGDQWAEFCREVWDTVETNKANLPLDLTWYDNYRPREVQITGLGYQFVQLEFTGIVVLMGYLGRDGDLIENIDLPAAVLDDLLKTWGGEWNTDDITQFIAKRQGEDPETGFSYSSGTLWPEVEAYLKNQGWSEAK